MNETSGPLIVAVSSACFGVMLVFVGFRVYTKGYLARKATWDDATCALAVSGAITDYVATVFFVKAGFSGEPTIAQSTSKAYLHSHYIAIVIVPFTLMFTKLSFYLLYLQLFWPNALLRWFTVAGAFITTAFYLATAVTQFVVTTPNEPLPTHSTEILGKLGLSFGVFGVVSDIYILLLPITGVMQLQLTKSRKAGVILVFLTGLLACVASILNLHYRLLAEKSGNSNKSIAPVTLLSLLEMFIGISCSCMPAFTSILRRHLPQYKIFKTRVLPTISSSGFSDRSKKFVFTGVKQPINGHYSNLEAQRPNVVSDQQMELGSFQALCTVIEVGLPGEVTENGIYLEQAIRQTSARHAQADNFGNLV